MIFFRYLIALYPRASARVLVWGLLASGLYVAAAVVFVETAAAYKEGAEGQGRFLIAAAILLSLGYLAQKIYFFENLRLSSRALDDLGKEIMEGLLSSDLRRFEQIPASEAVRVLGYEAQTALDSAYWLFTALFLYGRLAFSLLYIAWVSPSAGLFVGLTSAVFLFFYIQILTAKTFGDNEKAKNANARAARALEDVLKGAKESLFNHKRRSAANAHVENGLEESKTRQLSFARDASKPNLYNPLLIYMLSGGVVLLGSLLFGLSSIEGLKILMIVFFLPGPIAAVVWGVLWLQFMKHGFKKLLALRDAAKQNAGFQKAREQTDMVFQKEICLKGLSFGFEMKGDDKFGIGPIDLSFRKGEIVFLTGVNGGGKSTFIKCLTGLYHVEGEIKADGVKVMPENLTAYQNIFGLVLSDFHLFGHLYGLENAKPEKVRFLIKMMGLEDKTGFENGAFTNTSALSTGQKKRLALIASLLEKKEFYILDEVAGDQDPEHKAFFYDFVLNDIRKAGKTALVVSHEPAFYRYADRVLQIENGLIRELQPPGII